MNPDHYRNLLLAREQELIRDTTRLEAAGRESRLEDVGDAVDDVIASEAQAVSYDLATTQFNQLEMVRSALARIDDGTYGKCVVCGREIDEARLNAVPWTQHCRDHAQQS